MSQPIPRQSRARSVNGYALRAIRESLGLAVADVVAKLHCDPSTISKLETGARRRARPVLLAGLAEVYGLENYLAFLACPYGEDAHEEHAPAHDEIADTDELERIDLGALAPPATAPPDTANGAPAVVSTVPAPRRRVGAKHRAGAR